MPLCFYINIIMNKVHLVHKVHTPLKCLHTNACSIGNKQEELEIYVQSQGHDFIAITETWWDSSHDWNVVIDGYRLF